MEKDLKKIEEEIESLERKRTELEEEMATPEVFGNFDKLQQKQQSFDGLEKELNKANEKWNQIATAIDEINKG